MNSFLQKIYFYRFLDAFTLIGIIFALFFSKQGLSAFEISILISVWSATTILTEVPMGTVADKYSRRNLLILGLVLKAVGFVFWYLGGFLNYAVGFILWGLKNTLTSGTMEAFIYDELNYYKKQELYEKINGRVSAYFSLGLLTSGVVGGFLAEISFDYVLTASILTSLIAALPLLLIKQVKQVQSTGEERYFELISLAIKQIKDNKSLLLLITFICVVFSAYGAVDEFWNLIYEDLGLSTAMIGVLTSVVYAVGMAAGYFVTKLKVNSYWLISLSSIVLLIFGLVKSVLLIPTIFVAIYFFQVANIKMEAKLQHHIKPGQRATISSLKSFFFEIVYMFFVLFFGWVGASIGVLNIIIFASIIILIVVLVFLFSNISKKFKI